MELAAEHFVWMLIKLAESYKDTGRLTLGISLLEQAIDLCHYDTAFLVRMRNLEMLGEFLLIQKEHNHFQQLFEKEKRLLEANNLLIPIQEKIQALSIIYTNLATAAYVNDTSDTVFIYLNKVKNLFDLNHLKTNLNFEGLRDAIVAYERIAFLLMETDRIPHAIQYLEQVLSIAYFLIAQKEEEEDYKQRAINAYHYLGIIYAEQGFIDKALEQAHECFKLVTELHQSNPTDSERTFEIAITHEKLGSFYQMKGSLVEAETHLKSCIELLTLIHHDYPQNIDYEAALAIGYYNLADLYQETTEDSKLLLHLKLAQQTWEVLYKKTKLKIYSQNLREVEAWIKQIE